MPLTGHPIFKVGTFNTPGRPTPEQEDYIMRQTIIKAVSPSPEPEDDEEAPSSPVAMPSLYTTNDSLQYNEGPALSKATSANANAYTPPTYIPPSNTTERSDAAAITTPLAETEDTKEAEEEHDTPLLPLIAEVNNQSTPRNTSAFILLWIVAIVLAPLGVAMVYAAYCIFVEFSLERWLAVIPVMSSFFKNVEDIGDTTVGRLTSEVSEGHAEL